MIPSSQTTFLYDIFCAYYDARRNKRNTKSQLGFELHYEEYVLQLAEDLREQTYSIGQSKCFLICDTVPREIFAADFRDRVVHHLVYNYIYDICDRQFIHDSYSCRVGKGIHYGVKRLDHFIRSCSHNYTQDCYILKLDIKGFFMNIDKERLKYALWKLLVDKQKYIRCPFGFRWLRQLLTQIIEHNPLSDYHFQGSKDLYKVLPRDKSLFACDEGIGLPIGNLTSQLFANVYLHTFDVWMKQEMQCRYYGRYVDDFVIVHQNKEFLTSLIPRIQQFLQDELGVQLHPKKIYLQHYTKGVKFLGAYIKPRRIYISRRVMGNAQQAFRTINTTLSAKQKIHDKKQAIRDSLAVINSYLGMMKHRKNYKKRKELVENIGTYYQGSPMYTKCSIYHRNIK